MLFTCMCTQWTQLNEAASLLSSAPDDEVLAEIIALQSELVQQVSYSACVCVSMCASIDAGRIIYI